MNNLFDLNFALSLGAAIVSVAALGVAVFSLWKTGKRQRSRPDQVSQTGQDSALQLLRLLQSEARFIDLVYEDTDQYSDMDIGAAARAFILNCRQVLDAHFDVRPVIDGYPGTTVSLKPGFDRSKIQISGETPAGQPASYVLEQPGWIANRCSLPEVPEGENPMVLALAQLSGRPSRPQNP